MRDAGDVGWDDAAAGGLEIDVTDESTPAFHVVRGTPTAEELAALVGVLWGRRGGPAPAPRPAPSRWRASALPAAGLHAGRGAWRASALPR
jgi:hypothetical protein